MGCVWPAELGFFPLDERWGLTESVYSPERARQMVADADRAKMLGQFDQAIRTLQCATILVPDYAPAYQALASSNRIS